MYWLWLCRKAVDLARVPAEEEGDIPIEDEHQHQEGANKQARRLYKGLVEHTTRKTALL